VSAPPHRAILLCWGLWLRWRARGGRWAGGVVDRPTLYRLMAQIGAEHARDDDE
jgi:hypothetical protein